MLELIPAEEPVEEHEGDWFLDALVAVGVGGRATLVGWFNTPHDCLTDDLNSYWDYAGYNKDWEQEPGLYRVHLSFESSNDAHTGDSDTWLEVEEIVLLVLADPALLTESNWGVIAKKGAV